MQGPAGDVELRNSLLVRGRQESNGSGDHPGNLPG